MTITIAHRWDGAPLPGDEQATLSLAPAPGGLLLRLDAPAYGDAPPSAPPGATWALWEHEVVELFIVGAEERYLEIEIGPHCHHLVLELHGVRNIIARELPLDLRITPTGDRWGAEALIPRGLIPPGPHRLAAFAIHGPPDARCYHAAPPLPGPKPDFHQPERFLPVTLPLPI